MDQKEAKEILRATANGDIEKIQLLLNRGINVDSSLVG